jgi:hypothetical protein
VRLNHFTLSKNLWPILAEGLRPGHDGVVWLTEALVPHCHGLPGQRDLGIVVDVADTSQLQRHKTKQEWWRHLGALPAEAVVSVFNVVTGAEADADELRQKYLA